MKQVYNFLINNDNDNLNIYQTVDLKYKIEEIESEFYNLEDIKFYADIINLIKNIKRKNEIRLLEI